MPPAVAYWTVTDRPLCADSVTLSSSVPASSLADLSPTDSVGVASSSLIVPVAVPIPLASVAFTGLLSRSSNCSAASSRLSSATVTATVFVVSPAANVSVPLAAV